MPPQPPLLGEVGRYIPIIPGGAFLGDLHLRCTSLLLQIPGLWRGHQDERADGADPPPAVGDGPIYQDKWTCGRKRANPVGRAVTHLDPLAQSIIWIHKPVGG